MNKSRKCFPNVTCGTTAARHPGVGMNLLGKSLATDGRRLEKKNGLGVLQWLRNQRRDTQDKSASSLIIGKQELPETILWTPIWLPHAAGAAPL